MRKAEVNRKTGETDIRILLDLDGTGRSTVDTGVGFLENLDCTFLSNLRGAFDKLLTLHRVFLADSLEMLWCEGRYAFKFKLLVRRADRVTN